MGPPATAVACVGNAYNDVRAAVALRNLRLVDMLLGFEGKLETNVPISQYAD
jgi:hypothetical protein